MVTTKFEVGENVFIKALNREGIIKEINAILKDGNSLYLVEVDNSTRLYAESYLDKIVNNEVVKEADNTIIEKINNKIYEIITDLDLVETNDEKKQVINACRLQKYLVLRKEENEIKFLATGDLYLSELYDGLFNQEDDYINNTIVFNEVLKRVGMTSYTVALKDEEENFYMANLVLIGDKYYYFDVSLEKDIYLENSTHNIFVLCCAALGRENYEKYFKPLCLIDLDDDSKKSEVPNNIAEKDYDVESIKDLV